MNRGHFLDHALYWVNDFRKHPTPYFSCGSWRNDQGATVVSVLGRLLKTSQMEHFRVDQPL